MRNPLFIPVLVATGLLVAAPAHAQSNTGDMELLVEVINGCTVTATDMRFNIPPGAVGPVDSSATIGVRCNETTFFRLDLDRGENAAGTQRRMISGEGIYLPYAVFSNTARTSDWGSGFFGGRWGLSVGTLVRDVPVYGRITTVPASLAPGTYRDTITVTVEF